MEPPGPKHWSTAWTRWLVAGALASALANGLLLALLWRALAPEQKSLLEGRLSWDEEARGAHLLGALELLDGGSIRANHLGAGSGALRLEPRRAGPASTRLATTSGGASLAWSPGGPLSVRARALKLEQLGPGGRARRPLLEYDGRQDALRLAKLELERPTGGLALEQGLQCARLSGSLEANLDVQAGRLESRAARGELRLVSKAAAGKLSALGAVRCRAPWLALDGARVQLTAGVHYASEPLPAGGENGGGGGGARELLLLAHRDNLLALG